MAAEAVPAEPVESGSAAEPVGAGRENGVRLGLRFRRGSRGGLRAGEIPLIGVVQVDEQPSPEPVVVEVPSTLLEPGADAEPATPKRARPRRAPRKKAATTAATKAPPAAEAPPAERASPPKRPRARARKKAE